MVGDADTGSNPSENAQPLAGRDDVGQRPEVRAPVVSPPRGPLYVGLLQRDDQQAEPPEVRLGRLRLPQVRPFVESW